MVPFFVYPQLSTLAALKVRAEKINAMIVPLLAYDSVHQQFEVSSSASFAIDCTTAMSALIDVGRVLHWVNLLTQQNESSGRKSFEGRNLRFELLRFQAEADKCHRATLRDWQLPEEGEIFLEQQGGAMRDEQMFQFLPLRQYVPRCYVGHFVAIFWLGGPGISKDSGGFMEWAEWVTEL